LGTGAETIPVPLGAGISLTQTLLQMAAAASKSATVAEAVLRSLAKACAATLTAWSMDDVAKLLFALVKVKGAGDCPEVVQLYGRAAEAVSGKMSTVTDSQLIKVLLALGRVPSMKEFVEFAATEVVNRLEKVPAPQLLLLTQGILPLGGGDASVGKVLDHWAASGADEAKIKLTEEISFINRTSRHEDNAYQTSAP